VLADGSTALAAAGRRREYCPCGAPRERFRWLPRRPERVDSHRRDGQNVNDLRVLVVEA